MRYEVSGGVAPRCLWGAVAHREADGGEYHPLRWLAGMRAGGLVREPAYSKISYSKDSVWEEILRLPCRADLEDGRAGGYSMSLDFFAYFFYQEKKYEKNYIHTDHLGSYCAITNEAGKVVQRNCFDPWGNYAFEKSFLIAIPDTLKQVDSLPCLLFPITARGFTGHEHYPYFKIINMNGRLYDPVNLLNPNSILAQEIRYLQRHGYVWDKDFLMLIKQ